MNHGALLRRTLFVLGLLATGAAAQQVDRQALIDAERALRDDQPAAALPLLDGYLRSAPRDPDALRLRAIALFALERGEARDALTAALRGGSFSADVLSRLLELDRQADPPRTLATLTELAWLQTLEPTVLQWQALTAQALAEAGATDLAAATWRELLELDPSWSRGWLALGDLHLARGESEAARQALQTAAELGSIEPKVAITIAELWHRSGGLIHALNWYRRAERLDAARTSANIPFLPSSAGLSLRVARIQHQLGDHDEVRSRAGEALGAAGMTPAERGDWSSLLARDHWSTGEFDQAAELALTAAEVDHVDLPLLRALARRRFDDDQFDDAVKLLQAAGKRTAPSPESLALLIRSFRALGRASDAQATLVRYLEQFGLDELAEQLLDELSRGE